MAFVDPFSKGGTMEKVCKDCGKFFETLDAKVEQCSDCLNPGAAEQGGDGPEPVEGGSDFDVSGACAVRC